MYDIYNYDEIALVNNADIDYLLYLAKVDRAKFLSYIEYTSYAVSLYSVLAKFKVVLPTSKDIVTFNLIKNIYFGKVALSAKVSESISLTELRANNPSFERVGSDLLLNFTKAITDNFSLTGFN